MRQSVRIVVENLYKFKVFGDKTLIRNFSDKGWNVKSLNNLLKKIFWHIPQILNLILLETIKSLGYISLLIG